MSRIIKVPHSGFIALTVTEFESSSTCDERIVCLNSQEVTIIRKAIEPFYWPTRYGEFVTPGYFQIAPNGALIEALEGLETKMGCNDLSDAVLSLADSLERGLKAIANKPCCNDTTSVVVNLNGGVNGVLEDGTVTYGTVAPIDKPAEVPPGFTDEQHFDSQLCARAAAMVDGVIIGFGVWLGIESLGAVGLTVGLSLGFIGIITIPEVMLPTLIAAISIAYLAAGSLYAVREQIIAHRQDLICILYNGEGTAQVSESLAELFDIIIAAANVSGPVGMAIKTILLILFSSDTINKLYDAFAGTNYGEADCSSCDDLECPVELYFVSDIATVGLPTLTNFSWSGETVVGTTGAWVNPVRFSLFAADLEQLIGAPVLRDGVRLRITVYLPENAQTDYYYGIDTDSYYNASGNNGYGAQTYYIDHTFTGTGELEEIWFQGNGNSRQYVLSDIKVDIPCESLAQ